MALLTWLEELSLSAWVRESPSLWAFPMLLFVHTLGVSLVAGGSTIIAFALIGRWPAVIVRPLERLYPFIWGGFAINLLTGTAIFLKDATSYGRNLDFYVKLVLVAIGVTLIHSIRKQVFGGTALTTGELPGNITVFAWASLGCWFGAIIAGRLIAYVGPVPGL